MQILTLKLLAIDSSQLQCLVYHFVASFILFLKFEGELIFPVEGAIAPSNVHYQMINIVVIGS